MVDYLDNELDSRIEGMLSPECHPTHFNLTADFDKIVGKSQEEKEALNLPRYYISELIGIKPDEIPPYEVMDKIDAKRTQEDTEKFINFGTKVSTLLEEDNICDEIGIKFIAKFLVHYSSNKDQVASIKSDIVTNYVKGVLSYNSKTVDLIKKVIKLDL